MKSLLCFIALNTLLISSTFGTESLLSDDNRGPRNPLDTPIGDVYYVGSSWYDMQHNQTAGKMIATDSQGNVHLVWTKGAEANASRHVYYNIWNPHMETTDWPEGTQVDQVQRAGFATVAVSPAGWAYPTFHQLTTGGQNLMQSAMDFDTYAGSFIVTQPNPPLGA